eukprot:768284-Hanusia_phi.AAC.3
MLTGNRNLGIRLGQGEKLEEILASSTEVAEGYATALSLVEFLLTKVTSWCGLALALKLRARCRGPSGWISSFPSYSV